MPLDRGGACRPSIGIPQRGGRRDVSIRAAATPRGCGVIERPKPSSDTPGAREPGKEAVKPPAEQPSGEPIVFVIDDDISMRRALTNLFESVGLKVESFGSAPELMKAKLPEVPSCLVLDIRLPGLSGLDLQTELAKANVHLPIIFITGHGDIPMTVRAMKGGAVDFLTKPFRDQDLLDAVVSAIDKDRRRREADRTVANLQALFDTLSSRERDVLGFVAAGLM